MAAELCDELPFAVGRIEREGLHRTAHAVATSEGVWVLDPFEADGMDARVRELGEPAGVIQLLDRHARDGAALARRYGVPLHLAPRNGVPRSPFEVLRTVNLPLWREAALWWPERKTLVVADALGTASYFLGPGERLAVHPLLRLLPPRSLGKVTPEHVLCGHGEGVHGAEAGPALVDAVRTARRGLPRWLVGLVR